MQLLDLTLPTAEENLALDEALLEAAEAGELPAETLRIWMPQHPLVVAGRSTRIELEIDAEVCAARCIPVLRRPSGGAAIVAGPGCLMYALVLCFNRRPAARAIDQAHAGALAPLAQTLGLQLPGVSRQGISDLAWNDKKFSGNSMRARRDHFLYHGTLLCGLDMALLGCLRMPPRQPQYRQARSHADFLTNIPLTPADLRTAMQVAWQVQGKLSDWPRQRVRELVSAKYSQPDWNG